MEASIDILLLASGSTDRDKAELIAVELGGLPLALQQAGAYIAATPGATLDGYFQLFKERCAELLELGQPPDYPRTIATTWSMTLNALPLEVASLLYLLSSYPVDSVPLRLLKDGVLKDDSPASPFLIRVFSDKIAMGSALRALAKYSLIAFDKTNDRVAVHCLLRQVALNQLSTGERAFWHIAAVSLLDSVPSNRPADRTLTFFTADVLYRMDAKDRARFVLSRREQDRVGMAELLSQLQSLRTAMSQINNIR